MGLIEDYVEVNVSKRTYKYYENLGYVIPKRKDSYGRIHADLSQKITVKVDDLPLNSRCMVKVQCDNCNKKFDVAYTDYLRYKKDDGKYYCHKCATGALKSGELNPNWNPNKTQEEREVERRYPEYTAFVKRVLARDNYTCMCCGKSISGHMLVHHLEGYAQNPDLRCDDENGATLCDMCHCNFHSIYGYGNNTKEQFMEWLGVTQLELKKYSGKIPTTRRIFCYEEDTIYDSVKMAQDAHNYKSHSSLYRVANHEPHHNTAHGKHWFWYDEYINMTEEEILFYVNK